MLHSVPTETHTHIYKKIALFFKFWGPALLAALIAANAWAGLDKDDIASHLGTHYVVGEPLTDLAVYPIFLPDNNALQGKPSFAGYAFQTADFADVRGFSGKRMNILVVLDPAGNLLATELVQHVEPLFARPGTASVLEDFTQQFENLNLRQGISIGRWSETLDVSANSARLTGVHMGTITVKAITRNVIESSMAVAAAKLDGTVFASFSAAPAGSDWATHWQSRQVEIVILLSGLALLVVGLLKQKWVSHTTKRLRLIRSLYLLFTLGFIGWHAQAQLTIVNVAAALESAKAGDNLSFFLSDPMTSILWVFVGITLLVWGRGTFCGWLCPFGALQEIMSGIASALGFRHIRIKKRVDTQLKWVKYALLAAIISSIFWFPQHSDLLSEIEPFKTAISLFFIREWPYVLWAVCCVGLSAVVYRGYCRYICPLGAALAIGGYVRLWRWVPRRNECGTPCQTCRHGCNYDSIEPNGTIAYDECFQCLDCVATHEDDKKCYPLVMSNKRPVTYLHVEGQTQ